MNTQQIANRLVQLCRENKNIDATYKEHGRMAFAELCVYQVKDGKIVAEEFFYNVN